MPEFEPQSGDAVLVSIADALSLYWGDEGYQRLLDEQFDMANVPADDPGHIDFAKAKAGNLGAEFFSIWVEPKFKGQFANRTMRLIDSVYQQAEKHPDRMMMAFSTADILAAKKKNKLAALMGIEGGHSIENDMGLLRDFYRLGAHERVYYCGAGSYPCGSVAGLALAAAARAGSASFAAGPA